MEESGYPVVVIEVIDSITDEDVDRLLADGERWLGRGRPYATVYVASKASVPSGRNLRRLAAWMKDHKEELDRYHRCAVYVTGSAVLRGFLRALFSLQPLRAQQHATEDLDEGIGFANRVLAEQGYSPKNP